MIPKHNLLKPTQLCYRFQTLSYSTRTVASILRKKKKQQQLQYTEPYDKVHYYRFKTSNYTFNTASISAHSSSKFDNDLFYNTGLQLYLPELKSLHSEFDFHTYESLDQLINDMNKYLIKLNGNLNLTHPDTNSFYFKIKIQLNRYNELMRILNSYSNQLSLKELIGIVENETLKNNKVGIEDETRKKSNTVEEHVFDAQPENEYKQIPNDFLLEEYESELLELRQTLNTDRFSKVSAERILDEVEKISNDKGGVWSKLFWNLSSLFKHNNNQTFVLDNILISAEQFKLLEERKPIVEYKQIPNHFNLEEFQNELILLKEMLNVEKFVNVPAKEVINKVQQLSDEHNGVWNKLFRNLTILFKHNNGETSALDAILISADQFEKFEKLKQEKQLKELETHSKSSSNFKDTAGLDVSVTASNTQPPPNSTIKPSSKISNEKTNYADSTKLFKEQSSAFDPTPKDQILFKKSKDYTKPLQKTKLEKYLDRIKIEEDGKKRELDALKFSNEMYKAKLLSSNFKDSNYMLITVDGQTVPTGEELIGNLPKEDIFESLGKFSETELIQFKKHLKKYQARGWKLIGSKVERNKKYFILVKSKNKGKFGKFLKTIIVSSGLIALSLIGLDHFIETPKQPKPVLVAPTENSRQKMFDHRISPSTTADVDHHSQQLSWWQRLFWTK